MDINRKINVIFAHAVMSFSLVTLIFLMILVSIVAGIYILKYKGATPWGERPEGVPSENATVGQAALIYDAALEQPVCGEEVANGR